MTYFQVSVGSLMAAGQSARSGTPSSALTGAALAGAGTGTPAAGACEELVGRLTTAAASAEEATLALAEALMTAAANYRRPTPPQPRA